jgi:hypothetical protein
MKRLKQEYLDMKVTNILTNKDEVVRFIDKSLYYIFEKTHPHIWEEIEENNNDIPINDTE